MFTYTAGAAQYTPKLRLSKFVKAEGEEGEVDAEADRGICSRCACSQEEGLCFL